MSTIQETRDAAPEPRTASGQGDAAGPPRDLERLLEEVRAIRWWHRIDLGNGIVTPGFDDTATKIRIIGMPADLTAKTVLDIGAWDGFYSFEAERRGASRVLAIDMPSWGHGGWGTKAGFDLAHRVLQSKVESRVMDALQLSPEEIGTFDLVLYLGMLYHMKNPVLALEKVFGVTRGMAIVETHAFFRFRRPMLEFYPGRELLGDETNWFSPNPAALEGMLRSVGFTRIVPVLRPSSPMRRLARTIGNRVLGRPRIPFSHGRLVYHAYR